MSAIEDLIDDRVDAAHVSRRFDDWVERLHGLYATIRSWLPDDWAAAETEHAVIAEEMMRKFGVPARPVPELRLTGPSGGRANIVPRGLWVIGANGSVDLRTPAGLFLVVDTAENFSPPLWEIARADGRWSPAPLDEDRFRATLHV